MVLLSDHHLELRPFIAVITRFHGQLIGLRLVPMASFKPNNDTIDAATFSAVKIQKQSGGVGCPEIVLLKTQRDSVRVP